MIHKIRLCSVLRPLQHSIGYMGDGFLQVKRPNQQYQSTEGSYKGKQHKEQRKHKIHMHRHTKNRQIQHTSITQQVL